MADAQPGLRRAPRRRRHPPRRRRRPRRHRRLRGARLRGAAACSSPTWCSSARTCPRRGWSAATTAVDALADVGGALLVRRLVADGDERLPVRAPGRQGGHPGGDRQPGRYPRRRAGDVQGRGRLLGVPRRPRRLSLAAFLPLGGRNFDAAKREFTGQPVPSATASRRRCGRRPRGRSRRSRRRSRPARRPRCATTLDDLVGQRADAAQRAHQDLVLLHLLGDAADEHPALVAGRPTSDSDSTPSMNSSAGRLSPSSSRPGIGLPYGDSVGWSSSSTQAALDGLGHHVLPAAGLGVHELPVEPDHVGEQPLGEPVLAHHPGRQPHALVGELEVAVALDGEQAVALHPGHGLARRSGRSGAAARRSGRAAGRCPPRRARRWSGGTSRWCRSGRSPRPFCTHATDARWQCWQRWLPMPVMWFRRDLRLADNPALLEAVRRRRRAAAVRPRPRAVGAGRAGRAAPTSRASLRALDASLRQRRAWLSVVRGDPVRRVRARRARGRRRRGCTSPPTSARTAARRDARGRAALAEHGIELVRTGSPYAVAPGRVTKRRRRRRTRSSRRSPGPGPSTAGARPVDAPTGASWLRARRHRRHPRRRRCPTASTLPAAGEAAARRRWREFCERAARRTTTDERDRPDLDATSHMSVHLKWGEIHPRTMLADLRAARGSAGAATYRKELAWREFYADVLFHQPGVRARLPAGRSSRGWRTTSRATQLDAWQRGPHRLPDRRRRHAPAARDRLDAQPGADDRGELPGQGPARRVAARRPALHAAGWSTATSPPTSTAGSGRPAAAPTRRRTSGSSTRPPRAGSSTPTATTSGAGSPSSRDAADPHEPSAATATRPDRRPRRGAPRGAGPVGEDQTMTDLLVPAPVLRPADRPATAAGPPARWPRSCTATRDDHAVPWPAISVTLRRPPPLDTPVPTTETDGVTDGGRRRRHRGPGRAWPSSRWPRSSRSTPPTARAAEASYAGWVTAPVPHLLHVRSRPRGGRRAADLPRPGRRPRRRDPRRRRPGPRTRAPRRTGTPTRTTTGGPRSPSPGPPSTAPAAGPPTSASGPMVLGRMTARVDTLPVDRRGARRRRPRPRQRGPQDLHTAATLYDADGRVVATAEHIWITVDPAAFR